LSHQNYIFITKTHILTFRCVFQTKERKYAVYKETVNGQSFS